MKKIHINQQVSNEENNIKANINNNYFYFIVYNDCGIIYNA